MAVAAAVPALGLAWCAWKLPEAKALGALTNWGLAIGSLIVTFAALEIALRILNPTSSLNDLSRANHEILGYTFRPDWEMTIYSAGSGEYRNVFQTDSTGLVKREAGNPENIPSPDARRILFIGDSFVAGMEVAAEANMSVQLARLLAEDTGVPYQSFNTGVYSYNPITYYLSYEVYKGRFDPEWVIVGVFPGNDITGAARAALASRVTFGRELRPVAIAQLIDFERLEYWDEKSGTIKPLDVRENKPGGLALIDFLQARLCAEPSAAPKAPEQTPGCGGLSGELAPICQSYELLDESLIRNNYLAIFKDKYTALDTEDWEITLNTLRHLRQATESDGRKLLIVIFPMREQVPGQGSSDLLADLPGGFPLGQRRPHDYLLAFCQAEGLTCLDLLPIFTAHAEQKLYWRSDVHLTEAGHLLTAMSIRDAIVASSHGDLPR